MASALTLTLKIKQDPDTLAKLQALKANFATQVQPVIDQALAVSQLVHFARVVVIDDVYIQVITEFDGDGFDYTEFFRLRLPSVFQAIFELAEGVPAWDELNTPDTFFKAAAGANIRSLGQDVDPDSPQGYLFDASKGATIKDIQAKLGIAPPAAS